MARHSARTRGAAAPDAASAPRRRLDALPRAPAAAEQAQLTGARDRRAA